MPFKSEAQRKKFLQLVSEGKMSQETFDEWDKGTNRLKLPERVKSKPQKRKTKTIRKVKTI